MTGPKSSDPGSPPDALDDTLRREKAGEAAGSESTAGSEATPPAPQRPSRPSLRPVGPGPLPRFPTDPHGIPAAKGREATPPEEKVFTRAPSSWAPEKTAKGAELPTGRASVGEFPTGEQPPSEVRPVPELDDEPDTAVPRPIVKGSVADLPTAAVQRRPAPDQNPEELVTAAMPARRDEEEIATAAIPAQKDDPNERTPPTPELEDEPVTRKRAPAADATRPLPPMRTGPRPVLDAGQEEDAEKKRDRMTAMLVLGFGLPLITAVYLVTRYEPAPPPERPHVVKTAEFKQNSGGGSHHGGGGGGVKKGGPELSPRDRPIIALGNDCVSKCAERQLGCSAGCKAGEKCREHCLDKARGCENACTGEKATIGDQMLDCLTDTGEPRKCTAADYRQEAAQANAVRSMCRDKDGEIIPCSYQLAKIELGKKLMEKQCGPDGKKCLEGEP